MMGRKQPPESLGERFNKNMNMRVCGNCYTSFYYYPNNDGLCKRCKQLKKEGLISD